MSGEADKSFDETNVLCPSETAAASESFAATALLDVVQACLHPKPAEWIFLRELRLGTKPRGSSAQRLDAFALNCFPHMSMKRVCYEVKISRADFLCELKHPLKRRIGLRYSNEFYFVTPIGLLTAAEVPVECGLIEVGPFGVDERAQAATESATLTHFNAMHATFCRVTIPAPWRETPGPTWQLVAGMLRNQQKAFAENPPKPPNQQRLPFTGLGSV